MNQLSGPPLDHFDRGKPFFPLVVIYAAALSGLMGMMFRGVLELAHEDSAAPTLDEVLDGINTGNAEMDADLRKLRSPLMLQVASGGGPIAAPIESVAREVALNHSDWLPWLTPTLGSILMLAYEILCAQLSQAERLEPVPQFLRHVRNGVAHNGRFDIRAPLKHPAAWRPFVLDMTMDGTRVFKDSAGVGLLGPGDPIRLLWDIEQAYPTLRS